MPHALWIKSHIDNKTFDQEFWYQCLNSDNCVTYRLFAQFAGQPLRDISHYCRCSKAFRDILGSFAGNMTQLAKGETLQCEQELTSIVHAHLFTQGPSAGNCDVYRDQWPCAVQFLKFPNPISQAVATFDLFRFFRTRCVCVHAKDSVWDFWNGLHNMARTVKNPVLSTVQRFAQVRTKNKKTKKIFFTCCRCPGQRRNSTHTDDHYPGAWDVRKTCLIARRISFLDKMLFKWPWTCPLNLTSFFLACLIQPTRAGHRTPLSDKIKQGICELLYLTRKTLVHFKIKQGS